MFSGYVSVVSGSENIRMDLESVAVKITQCLKQLDFITTQHRSPIGNKNTVRGTHGAAGSRAQRVFNHKQNPHTSSYESKAMVSTVYCMCACVRVSDGGYNRYFTEPSFTFFFF